jgi:short-subunit dehydrogenase
MTFQLALVTGATSGIGESLCYLLANKRIPLIIVGRNEEHLSQLKNELEPRIHVQAMKIDLSVPSERKQLIKAIHQSAPDLVINNAGFGLYGEALTYTTSEQEQILQVNGNAVLELTLEAARTLISKKKKGVIVNVSSAAAFQVMPDMAVYAAIKAFLNQFSQALDVEVQSKGVRVLVSCPGMVDTHFRERAGGIESTELVEVMSPESVAKKIWWQIQTKRTLLIMNWKYWLLTHLASFLPQSIVIKLVRNNMKKRIIPRTFIEIGK